MGCPDFTFIVRSSWRRERGFYEVALGSARTSSGYEVTTLTFHNITPYGTLELHMDERRPMETEVAWSARGLEARVASGQNRPSATPVAKFESIPREDRTVKTQSYHAAASYCFALATAYLDPMFDP